MQVRSQGRARLSDRSERFAGCYGLAAFHLDGTQVCVQREEGTLVPSLIQLQDYQISVKFLDEGKALCAVVTGVVHCPGADGHHRRALVVRQIYAAVGR